MSANGQRCAEIIERLITALQDGDDVSEEDRQHVAACPDCKRVLAAAGQLEEELEADRPAERDDKRLARVTHEAEAVLRGRRWRLVAFIALGALAAAIPWFMRPRPWLIQVAGALVLLGAVGSLVVDGLNARAPGLKLYKRLKRQWFFGVCRGLAEGSGLPVAVIRGAFVALLLVGRKGWLVAVPLYLLLDASLQVHPEDRRLLLRFRLKRWTERLKVGR